MSIFEQYGAFKIVLPLMIDYNRSCPLLPLVADDRKKIIVD